MNIPDATLVAKLTLEAPGKPVVAARLYRIEGEKGLWTLLRKSKRTTAVASCCCNRIAVFPHGDNSLVFGEFEPASSALAKDLQGFGFSLYTESEMSEAEVSETSDSAVAAEVEKPKKK